uniref:Uncharacterized protein n=1 Tax=Setaria digitata TaxID=48799 RepID=A0A915Q7D4_9BILA
MPTTTRRRRSRTIRPIPKRSIRGQLEPLVRRRLRSRPSTSSHSRSTRSGSSSSSSLSSRRRSHGRQRQKRLTPRVSRKRTTSVIPLYGTNGTMVIGYVRRCRSGVKLCRRDD